MSDANPILDRLSRAAESAGVKAVAGDDQRAATFVRALVLGALVGAAIAGSTIWQRRREPADRLDPGDAQRPAIAPPLTED